MPLTIPDTREVFGLRTWPGGAHSGKTLMLTELRLLFAASRPDADHAELRRLVIEDNVLLKATASNRKELLQRMSELYGLRQDILIYRSLRTLWQAGEHEQPVLAVLCAIARDTILRATVCTVLEQPSGASVTPEMLAAAIEKTFPERYSDKTKRTMSQNCASSWAQAGHLSGKLKKVRARAAAGPASTAYALLLGHLCGARGTALFETEWAHVLDVAPGGLDALAFAGSQRGWLEYRRVGSVVEISFRHLLGE